MKRIFIINGISKEVPEKLKETPAIGSLIVYSHKLYKVANVAYCFDESTIHIILNKA
jgi:hypothetical protein